MFEFCHLECYVDGEDMVWSMNGEDVPDHSLVDILNDLGAEGWTVVTTVGSETISEVLLQRQMHP